MRASLNTLTDGHLIGLCNRWEIYAVVDEELIDAEYGDKCKVPIHLPV